MKNDKYVLPALPYAYDALEPHIDAATMKVHYEGHHATYVEKLNETMNEHPQLRKRVEELLASLDNLPADIQESVRHNGGGHANHSLFWSLLTPKSEGGPVGDFSSKLDLSFGSFDSFKEKFSAIAEKAFGSGYAWLCADRQGKFSVFSTKDQDSPITRGLTPLLALDVWEHAYYLKHKNERPEYIKAFWDVVSWSEVASRWDEFRATGATAREWRLAS